MGYGQSFMAHESPLAAEHGFACLGASVYMFNLVTCSLLRTCWLINLTKERHRPFKGVDMSGKEETSEAVVRFGNLSLFGIRTLAGNDKKQYSVIHIYRPNKYTSNTIKKLSPCHPTPSSLDRQCAMKTRTHPLKHPPYSITPSLHSRRLLSPSLQAQPLWTTLCA